MANKFRERQDRGQDRKTNNEYKQTYGHTDLKEEKYWYISVGQIERQK
jgi:hypothetical protein